MLLSPGQLLYDRHLLLTLIGLGQTCNDNGSHGTTVPPARATHEVNAGDILLMDVSSQGWTSSPASGMLDVDVALVSDDGCVALGHWSNDVVQGTTYLVCSILHLFGRHTPPPLFFRAFWAFPSRLGRSGSGLRLTSTKKSLASRILHGRNVASFLFLWSSCSRAVFSQ